MEYLDLFGYHLTYQMAVDWALLYVLPFVWGGLASLIQESLKYFKPLEHFRTQLNDGAKKAVTRLMVALVCVILNVAGILLMQEPVTFALVVQLFFSYLAASATYLHMPDKPKEETEKPAA